MNYEVFNFIGIQCGDIQLGTEIPGLSEEPGAISMSIIKDSNNFGVP